MANAYIEQLRRVEKAARTLCDAIDGSGQGRPIIYPDQTSALRRELGEQD